MIAFDSEMDNKSDEDYLESVEVNIRVCPVVITDIELLLDDEPTETEMKYDEECLTVLTVDYKSRKKNEETR